MTTEQEKTAAYKKWWFGFSSPERNCMTTSHTLRTSSFEDDFGAMMREAERLIRRTVQEVETVEIKNTP